MSEVSQGPGWWLASDGRWYAPELHPDRRTPSPASVPGPGGAPKTANSRAKTFTNRFAILALGAGIISIVPYLGLLTFVLALVFGVLALVQIRRTKGVQPGKWLAIVGMVLAIPLLAVGSAIVAPPQKPSSEATKSVKAHAHSSTRTTKAVATTPTTMPLSTTTTTEPPTTTTTAPMPVTTTTRPAPPPTTVPAPPPTTAASAGCAPISDEGTCYEPGEYCRDDDHGVTGTAGDGETITCEDSDGWRWEPT